MSRRVRPSLFDIIFVIWVVVIPVGFGSRLINSDGDMARHIRLGEFILDQGALVHSSPSSGAADWSTLSPIARPASRGWQSWPGWSWR
jgi:hypothetical protein